MYDVSGPSLFLVDLPLFSRIYESKLKEHSASSKLTLRPFVVACRRVMSSFDTLLSNVNPPDPSICTMLGDVQDTSYET